MCQMAMKSQHAAAYRALPPLLRALRDEAGLSQRALGDELGKPQSWIHNCEVGNRRVDVAEFCAWSGACGVTPEAALRRFVGAKR